MLLEQVGCLFQIVPSLVEENNERSDLAPEKLAVFHAQLKAEEVALRSEPGSIVLGADTIVVLDGQILGKPRDRTHACEILMKLAGRTHTVFTGVAVVIDGRTWTDFAATHVTFRQITSDEIIRYVESGEPMDKAGAYAVQGLGALLVERIDGCYTNVVGLPLALASRILSEAGVQLL